jgi:hypothetical protein
MQDNFNIHNWRLKVAINELEEKQLCKECGSGYMEEGMCMECGYMEEGTNNTTDFNKKAEDFINKYSYIIKAAVKFYEERPDDYEDTLIQTIYNFFSDELGEDWTIKVSTPSPEDEKDYAYGWTDEKDEAFYNVLNTFLVKNNLNVSEAKATFTDKYDDNPKLKGGQKDLPDELQAQLIKKEGSEEDHEVFMAKRSLQAIMSACSKLMMELGDEERNIPGWIQDHIVNAENYIEQAAQGFHELDNEYEKN